MVAQPAALLRVAASLGRILAASCALFVLAACQSPSSVTFQGSTVQFFTWDRGSFHETALILGRLTLEDGCLFTAAAGSRRLLIWPRGWNAVERGGALVIQGDGHELRVGDDLHLGGGDHDRAFAEQITGRTIPAACRTNEYVVVAGF